MNALIESLNPKEKRDYADSLVKNIFRLAQRQKVDGVAGATSAHLDKLNGDFPFGSQYEIKTSIELLAMNNRALGASAGSTGGFLVPAEVWDLELLLRPVSLIVLAGGRFVTGLKANAVVPRQLTEATPYVWLAETDSLTGQEETFAQQALTPRRLGGMTTITRQLEFQTMPNVSQHVADSLQRGIFAAFDQAALQGTGLIQPLGIFNTPNLASTVTFGAAADLAHVVQFETKLQQANVPNPVCWFADPLTRAKWRTVARSANSSKYLWEDAAGSADQGNVLGYPAYVSTNVPASSVVFLNPQYCLMGVFGDGGGIVNLVVDPYTSKRQEKIEITSHLRGDFLLTNPNAVCINTDSTTQ